MRLDNPPTDRQSHASALLFGGEERLKNAFHFSDGEADARITHRNQYWTILGPLRCDRQLTARVFHRFDAVEHEVH